MDKLTKAIMRTIETVLFIITMISLLTAAGTYKILPAIIGIASLLGLLAMSKLEVWSGYDDWN